MQSPEKVCPRVRCHWMHVLYVVVSVLALAGDALAEKPDPRDAKYENGELVRLEVAGRHGYLIRPTKKTDPQKSWVWEAPFWLAINDDQGRVQHRMYVERMLAAGLHVAGIDVGTSCGSPSGGEVCQKFFEHVTSEHGLHNKARLLVQSNGGLIGHAWAFRHPQHVDRIGGIYPAIDFRSWPGLDKVVAFPEPTLGFDLSLDELTRRAAEFNPIDNLAPLAKAGVRVFHIHGDADTLVPLDANSARAVTIYTALGGDARVEVLKGLGHGGAEFYASESLVKFLIE